MVTDAEWVDIDGFDGAELVIVGAWMSPRIFEFKKPRFEEVQTYLSQFSVYFKSLKVIDIDKDGDMDLVCGNLGFNFYTKAAPMRL